MCPTHFPLRMLAGLFMDHGTGSARSMHAWASPVVLLVFPEARENLLRKRKPPESVVPYWRRCRGSRSNSCHSGESCVRALAPRPGRRAEPVSASPAATSQRLSLSRSRPRTGIGLQVCKGMFVGMCLGPLGLSVSCAVSSLSVSASDRSVSLHSCAFILSFFVVRACVLTE